MAGMLDLLESRLTPWQRPVALDERKNLYGVPQIIILHTFMVYNNMLLYSCESIVKADAGDAYLMGYRRTYAL